MLLIINDWKNEKLYFVKNYIFRSPKRRPLWVTYYQWTAVEENHPKGFSLQRFLIQIKDRLIGHMRPGQDLFGDPGICLNPLLQITVQANKKHLSSTYYFVSGVTKAEIKHFLPLMELTSVGGQTCIVIFRSPTHLCHCNSALLCKIRWHTVWVWNLLSLIDWCVYTQGEHRTSRNAQCFLRITKLSQQSAEVIMTSDASYNANIKIEF